MRYIIVSKIENKRVYSFCSSYTTDTACESSGGFGSGQYVSGEVGL